MFCRTSWIIVPELLNFCIKDLSRGSYLVELCQMCGIQSLISENSIDWEIFLSNKSSGFLALLKIQKIIIWKLKCKAKANWPLESLTQEPQMSFCLTSFKLSCNCHFQRAFTACSCVFKEITLIGSNQGNYFENATACSKRTLKTTVATQLYSQMYEN